MTDSADPPRFPSDEELLNAGWVRTSRRDRLILSVPRVGEVYWVDFPRDAYAPEFEGEHPGIVIRGARRLHDPCIVVPLTSRDQQSRAHALELTKNPNPVGRRSGIRVWAVCDHLYTVPLARLRPLSDTAGRRVYPRVEAVDQLAVFTEVQKVLAALYTAPGPPPLSPAAAPRPRGPNTLSLPAARAAAPPSESTDD